MIKNKSDELSIPPALNKELEICMNDTWYKIHDIPIEEPQEEESPLPTKEDDLKQDELVPQEEFVEEDESDYSITSFINISFIIVLFLSLFSIITKAYIAELDAEIDFIFNGTPRIITHETKIAVISVFGAILSFHRQFLTK